MNNKKNGLFLLFVFIVISFCMIACEEGVQENLDEESESEETNVVPNAGKKLDPQQVPLGGNHPELSEDDIVNLVESIAPYELEPTMTAEDRYNLRKELYQSISEEGIGELSSTISGLSQLLTGTVADDLYKNLINPSDPKWGALEVSNCYYTREKLEAVKYLVSYQPLLDDLNIVIKLCEEGIEEKDILKIVDARRILYDISNHLFQVPFTSPAEVTINYGDIHDVYFNASKTLEGSNNLISN